MADGATISPQLLADFEANQLVKYMRVVTISILVYDFFHMLDIEVAVVWRAKKWNLGNWIYIFSRLLPFVDMTIVLYHRLYPYYPALPEHVCQILYNLEIWCTATAVFTSEVMLVFMLYALTTSRFIRIWLIGQMGFIGTTALVTLAIYVKSLEFREPGIPIPIGCYLVTGRSLVVAIAFSVLAVNQFLLMSIAIVIGVSRYLNSSSTLVRILYRDGVLYYVVLFVVSLGEVIVIFAAPHSYSLLLTSFQRVMQTVLAAHVWLNARAAVRNLEVSTLGGSRVK